MAQGSSNKNFLKQKIRACAACSNQPNIFRYYLRHKPFNGGFAPEVSNKFFIHLRRTIHNQRLNRQREVAEIKKVLQHSCKP